jgi:hypothetical protein
MHAMSEHRNEKASFCPEKKDKLSRKSIEEKPQCADKAENPNIELLYVRYDFLRCKEHAINYASKDLFLEAPFQTALDIYVI